ncbi:MAG: gliding motility-associated C-terminal domain-containing protein, partial [Bacteroidia bacterium]|nr:gliding motility-associated C-terminal domain-containing protein [Bacteroidia bacterium]
NDYFQVSGKTLKSFHGIITNRWGKTLYEWDEWDKELYPTSGWDGKIKSNEASPGVYYYIIKAEGWDDIKYDLKGAFHLVREK